jgi:hypothetical protein
VNSPATEPKANRVVNNGHWMNTSPERRIATLARFAAQDDTLVAWI